MKIKPLTQFICDECGELIEKVEDGWLEWFNGFENPNHGFRIVHIDGASPRRKTGGNCYYPESGKVSDSLLNYFTQIDGLYRLLSFFKRNLVYPNEMAEIIRRIHIPYYEEARIYMDKAIRDGFYEGVEDNHYELKSIIEEYGND